MPDNPVLSQSEYDALFDFEGSWGYDEANRFSNTGTPQINYGAPSEMFNDPAPTGIEGLTGQATTTYIDANNNPEIFTPLPTGRQTGGQTNMADTNFGGWGNTALTGVAALGGAALGSGSPAGTGTGGAPASTGGGGFNLWDLGSLALTAYGAYASGEAAKDAGQLQYQSTQDASRVQREMFDIGKEGLDPYSEAGVPAINRESAILGLQGPEAQIAARENLYSGPGFEYNRDRIIGDVNRGASASGQIKSGNRLAALTDRLQGLYAGTEAQYVNQLGNLGRTGLSGASAIAGVSQNAGAQIGANTIAGGTNLANANLGANEAYQSGVTELYDSARNRWGR